MKKIRKIRILDLWFNVPAAAGNNALVEVCMLMCAFWSNNFLSRCTDGA